jgi:hypothetical protein
MKSLKTLISAAVAVSAMGSVSAVAQSDQAMLDAWDAYLATSAQITQILKSSPAVAYDATGLVDIMTGMMRTNIDNGMSSSAASYRGRPRWNQFDTPDVRIGIDNPDTRYLAAHIPNEDGQQIYKVSGNRSNSTDMILMLFDGTSPSGGGQTIEDENMVNLEGKSLKKDQDYEVYFSTAELYDPSYMLNWLEIGVGDVANVHSRYTVCDYKKERPGDTTIERIGTEGVSISGEEFRNSTSMARGIQRGITTMSQQQPFWAFFGDAVRGQLPPNFFPPWNFTGNLGITTQLSTTGYARIQPDEAMIVKFRTFDMPADYSSLQLHNEWGSSLPWGHASVNMSVGCGGSANSHQTEDGYTYLVLSHEDPGVHNWIDLMDYPEVFMSTRIQSFDAAYQDDLLDPQGPWRIRSQIVKLADLADALPADMKTSDEKKRTAQIAERQQYQRDKYAPW